MRSKVKQDVVYIVKCHSFYKIGVTNDILARLVALQTGNPYPIELVKTYHVPLSFEGMLHEILKKANQHERGEWFRLTPGGLDAIMEICDIYEQDCIKRRAATSLVAEVSR
jgi:hypothetical protein